MEKAHQLYNEIKNYHTRHNDYAPVSTVLDMVNDIDPDASYTFEFKELKVAFSDQTSLTMGTD